MCILSGNLINPTCIILSISLFSREPAYNIEFIYLNSVFHRLGLFSIKIIGDFNFDTFIFSNILKKDDLPETPHLFIEILVIDSSHLQE